MPTVREPRIPFARNQGARGGLMTEAGSMPTSSYPTSSRLSKPDWTKPGDQNWFAVPVYLAKLDSFSWFHGLGRFNFSNFVLKVVVGSDPNCDKAGAALTVNAGLCYESIWAEIGGWVIIIDCAHSCDGWWKRWEVNLYISDRTCNCKQAFSNLVCRIVWEFRLPRSCASLKWSSTSHGARTIVELQRPRKRSAWLGSLPRAYAFHWNKEVSSRRRGVFLERLDRFKSLCFDRECEFLDTFGSCKYFKPSHEKCHSTWAEAWQDGRGCTSNNFWIPGIAGQNLLSLYINKYIYIYIQFDIHKYHLILSHLVTHVFFDSLFVSLESQRCKGLSFLCWVPNCKIDAKDQTVLSRLQWMIACLVGCLVYLLVDWLVGWLVCLLVCQGIF